MATSDSTDSSDSEDSAAASFSIATWMGAWLASRMFPPDIPHRRERTERLITQLEGLRGCSEFKVQVSTFCQGISPSADLGHMLAYFDNDDVCGIFFAFFPYTHF